MDWTPASEEELWDKINAAQERMSPDQFRLWEAVRINPHKWELPYWGDEGGGFWVVGLMGTLVLWYNDIEDGFNISPYLTYGSIGDYRCNQDDLEYSVRALLNLVEKGQLPDFCGSPQPL